MCKASDFIKPNSIVVKITSLKVGLVRSCIGSLFCCYHDQGNFVKCCKNVIRARGWKVFTVIMKYRAALIVRDGDLSHLLLIITIISVKSNGNNHRETGLKLFLNSSHLTHLCPSSAIVTLSAPDVPPDQWQMPRVQSTGANCQLSVSF